MEYSRIRTRKHLKFHILHYSRSEKLSACLFVCFRRNYCDANRFVRPRKNIVDNECQPCSPSSNSINSMDFVCCRSAIRSNWPNDLRCSICCLNQRNNQCALNHIFLVFPKILSFLCGTVYDRWLALAVRPTVWYLKNENKNLFQI